MMQEKHKKDWNPGKWVLIWEYSAKAIQWIPTWQDLDGFRRSLHPCASDESSPSIVRVNGLRCVAVGASGTWPYLGDWLASEESQAASTVALLYLRLHFDLSFNPFYPRSLHWYLHTVIKRDNFVNKYPNKKRYFWKLKVPIKRDNVILGFMHHVFLNSMLAECYKPH